MFKQIYYNSQYKTFISGYIFSYLGNDKSITKPSKRNEMLLLFIRIIGCLDILLLSSYLALCIFDRSGQGKTEDFVLPSLNLPQHSTVYENIEGDLFSTSGSNSASVLLQ